MPKSIIRDKQQRPLFMTSTWFKPGGTIYSSKVICSEQSLDYPERNFNLYNQECTQMRSAQLTEGRILDFKNYLYRYEQSYVILAYNKLDLDIHFRKV
jgi:hypothetical protein